MALWPIPAMRSVSSEYRYKMHETSDNRTETYGRSVNTHHLFFSFQPSMMSPADMEVGSQSFVIVCSTQNLLRF